jgi:hypothetical protein
MSAVITAFDITWDPGLRGILVVLTGVVVLMGSVYMILATNLGARVGFLVSVAGLAGWMTLMGFIWAVYGIGYKGPTPTWHAKEVVVSSSPKDLSSASLPVAHDLSTWRELPADDPGRGEATAGAVAVLINPDGPLKGTFKTESDFVVIDAYAKGGKSKSFFNNWVPGPHPPHYAIVQVQRVKHVDVPFGETPAAKEPDPSQPVVSVIMVRDLGAKRLPSAMLTIASLIVFGVTCNALHRRDKALMAARASAGV